MHANVGLLTCRLEAFKKKNNHIKNQYGTFLGKCCTSVSREGHFNKMCASETHVVT